MIRDVKQSLRAVGVRGLIPTIKGCLARTPELLQVKRPDLKFPFSIRVPSSDVPTLSQIFIRREYDFDVTRAPSTILDAGANIGLAAIYFSSKFPGARIIAVEPEESNFELLRRNIAPYRNVTAVRAALWHENTRINLVDPGLGKWGFMTQAQDGVRESYGEPVHEVPGMTVDAIMKGQGIDHVDILKIDIEGAEREVFKDPSSWIGNVDALIVELHEHMKPGCNRSFYNGSNGFDHEWLQGENVFLTRSAGCLSRKLARQRIVQHP